MLVINPSRLTTLDYAGDEETKCNRFAAAVLDMLSRGHRYRDAVISVGLFGHCSLIPRAKAEDEGLFCALSYQDLRSHFDSQHPGYYTMMEVVEYANDKGPSLFALADEFYAQQSSEW